MQARAVARSGLTVALHSQVTRLTPLPAEELASGAGYQRRLRSGGAMLNTNWVRQGDSL